MDTVYDNIHQHIVRLASAVSLLRTITQRLELDYKSELDDLERLVTGHRYTVAVIGEFNKGKSTFINALLEADVLPAAIKPCSATLNRITFGWEPGAAVIMRGDTPLEERTHTIPLKQLSDYVTKLNPDAKRMSAQIEEAVIKYRTPFCRDNVDIYDTPGLNDDPTMTSVTMSIVPRINAAILIIHSDIPFSNSERRILEKLLDTGLKQIIFVVTAIDQVEDEEDRQRIVEGVRCRVKQAVNQYVLENHGIDTAEGQELLTLFHSPQVFGISGYQALQARIQHNLVLEEESGFPLLVAGLRDLLARKDGIETLRYLGHRVTQTARSVLQQITVLTEKADEIITQFDQYLALFETKQHAFELHRSGTHQRLLEELSARFDTILNEPTQRINSIKICSGMYFEAQPLRFVDLTSAAQAALTLSSYTLPVSYAQREKIIDINQQFSSETSDRVSTLLGGLLNKFDEELQHPIELFLTDIQHLLTHYDAEMWHQIKLMSEPLLAAEQLLINQTGQSGQGAVAEPQIEQLSQEDVASRLRQLLPDSETIARSLLIIDPRLVALRVVLRTLGNELDSAPLMVFVSECIRSVAERIEQQRTLVSDYYNEVCMIARSQLDSIVLPLIHQQLEVAYRKIIERSQVAHSKHGWLIGRTESRSVDLMSQLREVETIAQHAALLSNLGPS